MIYIFDTDSLRSLKFIPINGFPSFWSDFGQFISDGQVISVREVRREVEKQKGNFGEVYDWLIANSHIFQTPTSEDTDEVARILRVPAYRSLIHRKNILLGMPAADPFVIAAGKTREGCVITQETKKEGRIDIPSVCDELGVDCTNLSGFMDRESLSY